MCGDGAGCVAMPQVAATLSITATNAATRENSTLPLLGASRKMEEGQLGKDSRECTQGIHEGEHKKTERKRKARRKRLPAFEDTCSSSFQNTDVAACKYRKSDLPVSDRRSGECSGAPSPGIAFAHGGNKHSHNPQDVNSRMFFPFNETLREQHSRCRLLGKRFYWSPPAPLPMIELFLHICSPSPLFRLN
ncbi:hypothetical protein EYF80_024697 [Liparis tanakae]|uniref:Uncharacterized protein n=1 Tax=Liparis tanakae TaxID=230148 RepID=A0A4Z2HGU4_9TELE|nr:hypothetical protein EYF80_024697 [Liparis tanakae]